MYGSRDDIRDCLRFAGPGRALDNEVASRPNGFDDTGLRRVRIDNMNEIDWI